MRTCAIYGAKRRFRKTLKIVIWAIARALANDPRLILADEPTGNLDPKTAEHVFDALLHLIHTTGVAAFIATHNLELAARMDRVLRVENGLLVEVAPASVR